MQMLRLGGVAAAGSDNESVTSLEYHKPNNSTIGEHNGLSYCYFSWSIITGLIMNEICQKKRSIK